jgi:hypothetical protein
MRTFRVIALGFCVACAGVAGAGGAAAFDGTPSPTRINPAELARQGTQAFREGRLDHAIQSWTRAAEGGDTASAWRLARMFADGEGVERNPGAAVRWLRQIVVSHGDEEPDSPSGRIAGRALVELGTYYLAGIPGSDVQQDFSQALRMFYQAASVFGDADAQFHLGRMYLDGAGVEFNPRVAASWLRSAAEKGHASAQATLGELLFAGQHVPRRPVEGLVWLSLAAQQARSARLGWITSAFEEAYTLATDEERSNAARALRRRQ